MSARAGRRWVGPIAAVAIGVSGLWACGPTEPPAPALCGPGRDPVARVDGVDLSCGDFAAALVVDQGESFLGRYIERQLVDRAAAAAGVTVTDQEIDRAVHAALLETVRGRFGGDKAAMEAQLAKYGVTLDGWRAAQRPEQRTELQVKALLARGGSNDAAVDVLFAQRFGEGGIRRRIRHVFFTAQPSESRQFPRAEYDAARTNLVAEARALAERLRGSLEGGADFAALAVEHSDDAAAERGGLLTDRQVEALTPAARDAWARLKPGERTPVLVEPDAFRILQSDGVLKGAHYQGGHVFVSARKRTPDDTRPEATRFAEAKVQADDARAQLLAGKPLADVVAALSDDGVTRERGGDLGPFETGRLGLEVDRVLEHAALDTPTEPIRTPTGWEIVVIYRREADAALDRPLVRSLTISTTYPATKKRRLAKTLPDLAKASAEAALARIQGGADFAAVAREVSEDAATARGGGDVPNYRPGTLGDEIDAALATMRPGERRVVTTPSGAHVLEYTTELKTEKAAVVDELRREIARKPVTGGEIRRFIDGLKAKAAVERLPGDAPKR